MGKRKKSDEEDEDDDRLEDDDYDLLEENLGVKVQRRKRFKRVRPQIDDDESDGEDQNDNGEAQRERIAERIFDSEDVSAIVLNIDIFQSLHIYHPSKWTHSHTSKLFFWKIIIAEYL